MSKSKSEICISVSQQRLQVELGDGARSQGVENQCKHGLFTAKRRVSGTKETGESSPMFLSQTGGVLGPFKDSEWATGETNMNKTGDY